MLGDRTLHIRYIIHVIYYNYQYSFKFAPRRESFTSEAAMVTSSVSFFFWIEEADAAFKPSVFAGHLVKAWFCYSQLQHNKYSLLKYSFHLDMQKLEANLSIISREHKQYHGSKTITHAKKSNTFTRRGNGYWVLSSCCMFHPRTESMLKIKEPILQTQALRF